MNRENLKTKKERSTEKMVSKNFVTIIVTILIGLIAIHVAANYGRLFGLAVLVAGEGIFILQGLRKIEEDPPHKGILTILGKRQYKKRNTIYLDEGWRFLPFYPFLFGYVEVNVERKSFEVKTITRTPDRAEVEITVTLSLRPVSEYLIQYENNDGFEGVKKHLTGEIENLIREWAGGLQEGPMDWREIYQSKLEAASILIEGVARNQLPEIPEKAQEIPTYIWLRYFSKPRPGIDEVTTNEKKWAENDWEKVKSMEEKLFITKTRSEKLQEAIELRRREIQKVRSDEGELNIFDLGIRLERLNVSNVKLIGEAAKVADQQAKEEEERRAEILEMEHVKNLINELKEQFPEVKFQELRRIVQTERGKTPMKITELNLSSETMDVLSDILNVLKGGK